MDFGVGFDDILRARLAIAPFIHRTRLGWAPAPSARYGVRVHYKYEHHQTTGAFKLRGATNAVLAIDPALRENGFAAASTGNHGRALSHAARAVGARAVICMSALVPAHKRKAIEALGAEVRIVGQSQDDAQAEVDRLVAQEGVIEVPPFDHCAVIAGQGTLGMEIVEDAPGLDAVLVPLSGGGLISGVALAIKTMSPRTRVIGVSMERGAAMVACLAAGKPIPVREVATLADSLGGGIGLANRHTFAMVSALVDETVLVSEAEIAEAVRYLYETDNEVIEGGAAVGVAALLSGRFKPRGEIAIVLSGKNIDPEQHRRIVAGDPGVIARDEAAN